MWTAAKKNPSRSAWGGAGLIIIPKPNNPNERSEHSMNEVNAQMNAVNVGTNFRVIRTGWNILLPHPVINKNFTPGRNYFVTYWKIFLRQVNCVSCWSSHTSLMLTCGKHWLVKQMSNSQNLCLCQCKHLSWTLEEALPSATRTLVS